MGASQIISEENLPTTRASTEIRRRKVLRGLINGKTLKDAALDAGYSESTSNVACRDIMPHIRGAFQELMLNKIPLGKLSDTVAAGLDAEEKRIFCDKEGNIIESGPQIAWGERRRYSELAAKLMGVDAPKEAAEGTGSKALLIEVMSEGSMTRIAIANELNMKRTDGDGE